MRTVTVLIGLCLLSGCAADVPRTASTTSATSSAPIVRGVHPGEKSKVGFYYSVFPTCQSEGYAEVTVVKAPQHGKVSTEPGQDYPSFAKDNVRWDCNRNLIPSTQVFYLSDPGFTGKDSFAVVIRFASGSLRTDTYNVEVISRPQ